MKNRLCCFLCLLCFPLLSTGREIPGDKQGLELLRQLSLAQPMLAEAFDLLAVRDLAGAGLLFDRCLEALAENPGACFGKACIADRQGDLAGALAWMERAEAASLFLDRLWASQKTALLKASQQERDRLQELSLDLQVKGEISSVCRSHEYSRESAKAAQKAKDISFQGDFDHSPFAMPAEYVSLHGNLLFKLKRYGEAEAKYLAALALEPGHERCLNNLINLYFISGRIGPARDWLEKAGRLKVKVNSELARAVRRAAKTPVPGRRE